LCTVIIIKDNKALFNGKNAPTAFFLLAAKKSELILPGTGVAAAAAPSAVLTLIRTVAAG